MVQRIETVRAATGRPGCNPASPTPTIRRCRRRRSGSHRRHGRLDQKPGLSGWRIRIVLRGCHRVPDSDFGKSRTASRYPPTVVYPFEIVDGYGRLDTALAKG